jgi:hypothetical protein
MFQPVIIKNFGGSVTLMILQNQNVVAMTRGKAASLLLMGPVMEV